MLEFAPAADGDGAGKPAKQRFPLAVGPDGSAKDTVPAEKSGTFALIAEGDRGVKSEFPAQPLRLLKDEPPKLPRVNGIGEKPRQVRPTEKIYVECAATDDVAITKLVLEWKIGDGPVQALPLDARGLPAPQAEGKAVLSLGDRAKIGEKLYLRLAVTDNRDLPEVKLTPQTTYYPAKDWADMQRHLLHELISGQIKE